MNYMKKKKDREDLSDKNDSKEQLQQVVTSNEKDISRKKLHASNDESNSGFFRARSSTCEGLGSLAKDDYQLCLGPKHQRSRTLDSETRSARNSEGPLLHQHNPPMNSPLAARKFGRHLFEKRPSLPSSSPCSLTNSPRFARRHSDFISSKQGGLGDEDIRRLSNRLSELEKAKPKFGRQKRSSIPSSFPCSVTNSPRLARRSSECISSKKAGLSDEDIQKSSESLSHLEKAKPRPTPYEEKPFYLCPENGSFRRSYWKSESVALEKRIAEAQRRSVSRVEEEKVQEERPLADILPPLVLSSIYVQESNKAKRKEAEIKKKTRSGKKNGSDERLSVDVDVLTKDLSDCRYLRIPNNS